jgi:uncharacterized circularly permuted ATP-grasp superfamily protein/uncharacterized alpha-E superfamily protein
MSDERNAPGVAAGLDHRRGPEIGASAVKPPSAPLIGFAAGYSATRHGADEMIEPDGSLRPHWRMFVSQLDDLGPEELPRRWDQARRLIRENGITHNVYGDPDGLDRPWNLDMVPLLVPEAEWRVVSEALQQRATLLDALLVDLYGPAQSVAEELLPPELLYCNPGFLRACNGITLPRGQWLHLYAADLVRAADGQFRVLCDRTQAPSGAGYSLENRIVLSGILPTVYRQSNVQRLAPFFIALRRTLTSLARTNIENPRVVLLTPGPFNETYFEHAYLARYLGYTLVQGNDLTVRDGRVYLKTLGELQRVDVIFRRVDDDFCDPLEFYASSYLGVPGLLEAVREGNVAVANALGSGLLQAPAFLAFLPQLCKRFLGEELQMPSVQTWWCGEQTSLRYVLDHLSELVIKPAFPTLGGDPQFGDRMSREELEVLAAKIAARPGQFVAQEHVMSRTAPVLLNDKMQTRRFVLRVYLTAADGSYTVMPGGLARVTDAADSLVVSLQKGGGSKDTWILAESPVNQTSLLTPATHQLELNRGGGDLPSRVADDLFWLGRYVHRAEGDVRIARCLINRVTDHGLAERPGTADVLAGELLGYRGAPNDEAEAQALVAQVVTPSPAGGLRSAIDHVEGLIRSLRDRVSTDAWRILQGIERDLSDFDHTDKADQPGRVVQLLNRLAIEFLAFSGVVAESMTRGHAWRFLDMGNRVERTITSARLIRSALGHVIHDETSLLDAILEIADSSLTYRRRYFTHLDAAAVVDLLVSDEGNPRSIAYQVVAIEQHLASLPCQGRHPQAMPHLQLILQLRTRLRLVDLVAACKPNENGYRTGLIALMTEVLDLVQQVAEITGQVYFSHAAVARQLTGAGGEEEIT